MDTHVKVTAWLRIAWNGVGLIGALVVLLVFGGISLLMGASGDADALRAAPWLTAFGAVIAAIVGVMALPGLITGWGLLNYQPWARILNIVLSAFDLFTFPIGTVMGVYMLWVMFQPETVELFESPRLPGRYPTHF